MTKKVYKLGDKVRVRVADADKMLKTVDFELVSDIRDDEEEELNKMYGYTSGI